MIKAIFFALMLIQLQGLAQPVIEGDYRFSKQEMVAGFRFSLNGKFQFSFSYGAVDRTATGSFSILGDLIKLKSDKAPGKDFTVTAQSKKEGGYRLVFDDPDKILVNEIRCIFFVDGKKQELFSNDKGVVEADLLHCDTIYVQHPLYPDIPTIIKDKNNANNNFSIKLNPSLEQVSLKVSILK